MSLPYEVRTEHREGVEIYILSQGTETIAEVAPGLGFNCFTFNDGPHQVFQNVPFETFLKKPTNYGLPILFPYPNRIRDGAFTFQGRSFKVNPNRHGYVRDRPWNVLDAGASSEGAFVTADFDAADYPEAILEQFPFPFRIEVTYRLSDRAIQMNLRVDNLGESPLPWGFGIHPYFNRTPSTTIQVPARNRFELVDALPTGEILDLPDELDLTTERPIEGLTLDDIYTDVIADPDGLVRCRLGEPSTGHATVIEFDAATYPHIVVFTPPDDRPAVCIEPYTCPTDAFNLQAQGLDANINPLRPGGEVAFSLKIASRS